MSTEITTAFAQKFASNVELKLQQKQSRLRGAVMTQGMSGVKQGQIIQQVGSVAAVKKTTRHGDTPIMNTPHDARWVFPEDYHWGDLIDNMDRIKTLADFDSPYSSSAVASLNRGIDDEIIAAFFSDTTKTGETGGTTTDWTTFVAASTGHKIASGSQGLTVGKLISAKKALRAAENDLDEDTVYCAINAELEADLLAETQVISLDYNTKPVLVDGKLTSFMGINFIHTERLLTVERVPLPRLVQERHRSRHLAGRERRDGEARRQELLAPDLRVPLGRCDPDAGEEDRRGALRLVND